MEDFTSSLIYSQLVPNKGTLKESWYELYLKVRQDYDNEDWENVTQLLWNISKRIICNRNL
jgi:hypothetical protein